MRFALELKIFVSFKIATVKKYYEACTEKDLYMGCLSQIKYLALADIVNAQSRS